MIVELQEDSETGDLILPIPPSLMEQVGWVEGDTLIWEKDEYNRIVLRKKESDNENV